MQSSCNIKPIFETRVTSSEATALKVKRLYSCYREMTDLHVNLYVVIPFRCQTSHQHALLPSIQSARWRLVVPNQAATGASRVQAAPCGENELRLDPTPSALHMQFVTTCIIKHRKAQMQHSLWPMAAEELLREDLVNSPGLLLVNMSVLRGVFH